MSEPITFTLDGQEVQAQPGETIWQVASRLGPRSRTSATRPSPTTHPTATAGLHG